MGTTIWQAGFGSTEGRIVPANWSPAEGSYVFVLGSDEPGVTGKLLVGDNVNVSQSGTYPAGSFRFRARTRGPASAPDQCWWEASLIVGGTPVVVRRVEVGETLDWSDMGWEQTSGGSGSLAFQLTFRGPSALRAEPEIPAFYLDAIVFAAPAAGDFRLANRYPEPSAPAARADLPISFDLFPLSVSPSAITVKVNGVTAYTAGAFTSAFAGSLSAQSATSASQRWVIDPLEVWSDAEAVTVSVSDGTTTIAWSFTAQRTSGPKIAQVTAQDLQQVRVTFDEAPVAGTGTAGDALLASAYAFTRAAADIAVQVAAISVSQVSATVFDVMTDIPLSAGHTYTLTLENVADALGNVTEPTSPGATATFTAYLPQIDPTRAFNLYAMMPEKNRREDQTGELLAFLTVLQDPLDLLLHVIDSFADVLDPNLAPEGFVDAMLADLGNPFGFDLTLSQKRLLVQLLLPIYKQKGTAPGVVNALRLFLGISMVHVSYGWGALLGDAILGDGTTANPGTFILGSNDGLDPLTFELLTPVALTDAQIAQGTAIVEFMKRGECRFLGFVYESAPSPDDPVELGFDSTLGDGGSHPGTFLLH